MGLTREQKVIRNVVGKPTVQKRTPIATDMFLPNHSGDHSAGMVKTTPTTDFDIVNKKYVDDNLHDAVTLAGTPDYITIAGQVITRGTIDISDDTNLVAGTNITLSGDTLNVDDAFLINNGSDTTTGVLTAAGFDAGSGTIQTTGTMVTGDHGTASTDEVVNVCYGTGSAPTASSTTEGTLFVKYTA